MKTAPLFDEVADAPDGGAAYWLTADDGVQIRLGVWNTGERGTVLLFPGRTEYVEKYGRAAGDLAARGFAMIAVDWRGQGIADRLLDDAATGHVTAFDDYQRDVTAVIKAVEELDLPRPYYLIGHSMGGAIGLRALHNLLPVRAACFSAPMWGIKLAPHMRPAAIILSRLSRIAGFSHIYAPGTKPETYVIDAPFDDNMLTTEEDMWNYMKSQVVAHPELALGGPSLNWLHESLAECRSLTSMAPPDVPVITFLGTQERIVDTSAVHKLMGKWTNGELQMVAGAEHEVLMETPAIRATTFDAIAGHFAKHP